MSCAGSDGVSGEGRVSGVLRLTEADREIGAGLCRATDAIQRCLNLMVFKQGSR